MSGNMYGMDTPFGTVEIDKLDGTNYSRWSRQVKNALRAIGAWQLIQEGSGFDKMAESKRRLLNDRGFALIYNSVNKKIQKLLDEGRDSCQGAWKSLEMLYSEEEPTREKTTGAIPRNPPSKDLENTIQAWRVGRRESIATVMELREKLESCSSTSDNFQDFGTGLQVLGTSMSIVGSLLQFYPPARGAAEVMKNFGGGSNGVGIGLVGGAFLIETVFSKHFLKKVDNILEEDKKNTRKLLIHLVNSDEVDHEDLIRGLSTVFRKRYGHEKKPDATTYEEEKLQKVELWKTLTNAFGLPLMRMYGDDCLRRLGVGAATSPLFLNGAILAWSVFYLMSTRGLKEKAQYLRYTQDALKWMKVEYESSLPRSKKD